jgi:hypothetical protein
VRGLAGGDAVHFAARSLHSRARFADQVAVTKGDWHRTRSTHAEVLESLEAVIRAHPANGRVVPMDPAAITGRNAEVIDLSARLAAARAGRATSDGGPSDAA